MSSKDAITVNERNYRFPKVCAVVICLDGCEPEYLDVAMTSGGMPNLKDIVKSGTRRLAHSVIPSFTNPNNMSIATGRPPSVHGICGNFLFDPTSNQEVMMNDVRFLRAPTIFSEFYNAGAKLSVITAKDKLRALLGAGLSFDEGRAICFSSERASHTTKEENGIKEAHKWLGMEVPDVYSAELSEFVLASGCKLLAEWKPDVMYLSTTDFIQHKFAPNEQGAIDFYKMVDTYLGILHGLGAAIVLTADHGMKPKHDSSGQPSVIYVQDLIDSWLGIGKGRVILPITDPYVVHHGALGSFATIYLPNEINLNEQVEKLRRIDGIILAIPKSEAVKRFELPEDRIGDIVLISAENMTLGTSRERHDLGALKEPLRSHGGLTEQLVPFIVNRRLDIDNAPTLRNFDAFYYATIAASL